MTRIVITFEVPDELADAVMDEVANHIRVHAEGAPSPEYIVFRAAEYRPVAVERRD